MLGEGRGKEPTENESMTEAEWLASTNTVTRLEFLRGKASNRKFRLFAVGCCRYVRQVMPDERCRNTVEVAERFADGMATEQELEAAADAATDSAEYHSVAASGQSFSVSQGIYFAARTALHATDRTAHEAAIGAANTVFLAAVGAAGDQKAARSAAGDAASQYRRYLLNDIFANPFRPATLGPAWLTPAVNALVTSIYQNRAFERMPSLGDALAEAGCTNAEILTHCRKPGPHVRGCWLVGLLLGKE